MVAHKSKVPLLPKELQGSCRVQEVRGGEESVSEDTLTYGSDKITELIIHQLQLLP